VAVGVAAEAIGVEQAQRDQVGNFTHLVWSVLQAEAQSTCSGGDFEGKIKIILNVFLASFYCEPSFKMINRQWHGSILFNRHTSGVKESAGQICAVIIARTEVPAGDRR
jgi:hypothetical protein